MDKFELKEQLIIIYDTIDKLAGELFIKGANDEETAIIRSEVFSTLLRSQEIIKNNINNIY